jgi:hypothetical protein
VAKSSGLGDHLFVGGRPISGDVNSVGSISSPRATWEVPGINKSAQERLLLGRDGTVNFVAYFNDAAGAAHASLSTLPTSDTLITYLHGITLGNPAACLVAKQVGYDPTRGADGSLTFAVSAQGNAYGLEWCQQLTAGQNTDTSGANGTALDGGAATNFGAQFYLNVESVTGTSVTITIQDSADNVSFSNVTGMAFTAVTSAAAPAWQRIATSNTATIRRYVRVVSSGTFTEAIYAVAMNRNEVEGVVF